MHDDLLRDYELRRRSGCAGFVLALVAEAAVFGLVALVRWLR